MICSLVSFLSDDLFELVLLRERDSISRKRKCVTCGSLRAFSATCSRIYDVPSALRHPKHVCFPKLFTLSYWSHVDDEKVGLARCA